MRFRPATAVLAIGFTLGLALSAAHGQEVARKPSNCFALAQGTERGPERILPAAFGTGIAEDHVRIRFINHASFAIATPNVMAVTDYTGYIGNPDIVPTVVTMNNVHSTHWTPNPDPRIPHVLQGWPTDGSPAFHELELGEMLVRNVSTDTRGRFGEGALADGNSIFVFEAGGLCIGHLGHLHQIPNDEQYAAIGRLDVVMVPVDGGYTLSVDDMAGVVRRLRASVVLPMHWFSGASLQTFLAEMESEFAVVDTGLAELDLSLQDLPGQPTILVLQPAFLP